MGFRPRPSSDEDESMFSGIHRYASQIGRVDRVSRR